MQGSLQLNLSKQKSGISENKKLVNGDSCVVVFVLDFSFSTIVTAGD